MTGPAEPGAASLPVRVFREALDQAVAAGSVPLWALSYTGYLFWLGVQHATHPFGLIEEVWP